MTLKGYPYEDVFHCHMKDGYLMQKTPSVFEIREKAAERLSLLPDEHKRFDFPHIYKVGVSKKLVELQSEIITKMQKEVI